MPGPIIAGVVYVAAGAYRLLRLTRALFLFRIVPVARIGYQVVRYGTTAVRVTYRFRAPYILTHVIYPFLGVGVAPAGFPIHLVKLIHTGLGAAIGTMAGLAIRMGAVVPEMAAGGVNFLSSMIGFGRALFGASQEVNREEIEFLEGVKRRFHPDSDQARLIDAEIAELNKQEQELYLQQLAYERELQAMMADPEKVEAIDREIRADPDTFYYGTKLEAQAPEMAVVAIESFKKMLIEHLQYSPDQAEAALNSYVRDAARNGTAYAIYKLEDALKRASIDNPELAKARQLALDNPEMMEKIIKSGGTRVPLTRSSRSCQEANERRSPSRGAAA
jgi:hypothetical protein